ncbi:acetate--CoA ligase family protein [Thermodesulfobacteriota bacterium]
MRKRSEKRLRKEPDLEFIFHPKTIAVAGASNDPVNYFGYLYMAALSHFGHNLFPVNPRQTEIHGRTVYPSIGDIPGSVDYLICCIPARQVPGLIKDCAAKGIRTVQISSAGFSETGEEEGMRLEAEIAQMAADLGVRVIGPNCLGIYCPATGLTFNSNFPSESGCVGYISQSGGNTWYLMNHGTFRGIRFSKVISYGNGCDLDESDFLEYFTNDSETKIIAAYIEGTKNGPRFLRVLKEAARIKPVIIYKSGRTEAGTRAVAGHTGALAGSREIWESVFHQTGAIQVHSMEELADVILAFLFLSPPRGRNAGIIGVGGGASVQATDECEGAGLAVPLLPADIRKQLKKFTPPVGSSVRNPVDSTAACGSPQFAYTLELVAGCEEIDLLIIFNVVDWLLGSPSQEKPGEQKEFVEGLIEAAKAIDKPITVCVISSGTSQISDSSYWLHDRCLAAGFPVYPTVGRASRAIHHFIRYHQRLRAHK